jgi:hypothetical protein
MKTVQLTLVAFAAAFVSSTTFTTTPVSAHSDSACMADVHDFCGASDTYCKKSGRLACLNHHASGGTPPPPPDPAYSGTPGGGQTFSNGVLTLQMK